MPKKSKRFFYVVIRFSIARKDYTDITGDISYGFISEGKYPSRKDLKKQAVDACVERYQVLKQQVHTTVVNVIEMNENDHFDFMS